MKMVPLALLALALTSISVADEVVLKNGNHLTGDIVKLDDNKLVLKTDFADEKKTRGHAGTIFTAEKRVVIKTADSKIAANSVERKDGKIALNTGAALPMELDAGAVKSLRSEAEQGAYEKSLRFGLREGWTGGANFGLALARGNSETLSVSTGMNLNRTTLTDKVSLYATQVYSKDSILNSITANAVQGGLRYDHNLTKKMFLFVSGDFENNDLQKLDLRSILGSGLGWHAINSSRTILDIFGGLSWTRESYGTGLTNNIFSPLIGQELTVKLSANTVFKE